jgi:antitoxin component YwqK of YwqJK toxin-antitoxin module
LREESLELLTEKESIEPQRDIGAAPMSKAHWPDGNLKHEWENKSIWKDGNKMIGLKYEWEYKDGSRYEFFEKSENLKKSRVNGLFRAYWPKSRAGGIRYEWEYEDGKRADGVSKGWWDHGELHQIMNWKNGKKHGLWTLWVNQPVYCKKQEGYWKNGNYDGVWTMWYPSGQKREEIIYDDGKLISKNEWDEDISTKRIGKYIVSYTDPTDGGGFTFGREFANFLEEYKIKFENCLEVYSGPGFIGFDLLDKGIISSLDLTDINPVVEYLCNKTIKQNSLENKCNFYLSDNLKKFPTKEYDLIVGNPPHFPRELKRKKGLGDELRYLDLNLEKHEMFYKEVKKIMNKNTLLIFQENFEGTKPDDFKEMISDNNLYLDRFEPCKIDKRFYFLVVKLKSEEKRYNG